MTQQEKLNFLIQKISNDLSGKLIYECDDHYILFDRYRIEPCIDYFRVTKNFTYTILDFSYLRHAATWCILDKYNKVNDARKIFELDQLLTGKDLDFRIHAKLKRKNTNWEIYRDKLLWDDLRQKQILEEIDKYIILAKKCQQRGFKNELTRT